MPGGPIKKKGSEYKPENETASRVIGRERRGSDPKERETKERKESKVISSRLEKRAGREMKPLDPRIEVPPPKVESKIVPKTPTKTPASGKVTLELPNGDVYEGFVLNDKKHGPSGSYVFSSGDIYTGEWTSGYAQGRGSMTFVKDSVVDSHDDLWALGACLRLVPSVSFQLTGFDDEREKASKKSSVNNMLDDWKQVIGVDPPQAGIYTVEYLYDRLLSEGDSKLWLSWLYFCTKWEKSGYGSTSMFLAFPDLTRGGFMSLTQVLISSGLLEKLVMKYITSPPSPSSGVISLSPPSTPSADSSNAPLFNDAYDAEVQKLFLLCLDLGDDEVVIHTTIKKLKSTRDFVRPLLTVIPPYFSHSLSQCVSVFKKSHSSALHFLSQKTIALEKKIFAVTTVSQSAAIPQPAQRGPSSTPSSLPSQLKLLLKFYKERAPFSLFENLETAPRIVDKVLATSRVLQEYVERKIAALERDDQIFDENMEDLRSVQIKENEQNDINAEKFLNLYVQDKSSTFKILAEEHKRDVQMMEHIRKSSEELYKLLYNKAIDNTLSNFQHSKSLVEKIISFTSDKEIIEICAQIADVLSHQVSELHRIVHFYATFTSEKQIIIDTYIKDLTAISQKIQDTLNPPPPTTASVTSPSTSSYMFNMALNFTKGIIKNVAQVYNAVEDTSEINKSQVEAHTYKPINLNTLKSDTILLAALLRDHTDSDLIAKFTATVLVQMCTASPITLSKDLLASAILCVQDCPFVELRAASLNILQAHYGQDNEHRKEFVVNFMSVLVSAFESSLKELCPPVGTAVCDLLCSLTNGTDEIIAAVVTKIGIKKIIDLMDIGARQPQGEAVVYSAAQVLANIASKEEYLVEISSKGGLHRVLEVAKVGKIKAHMHIPEDQLQLGETLGTGTFAEVKRGLWHEKAVAIKIFREAAFTFRLEDFWKEVAIMSLIKHENILRLLGASIAQRKENSTFMLVTELMHKGTLRDIIRTVGPLPSPVIVKYALDVAQGLAYMHTLDILHRDIKASNILVDEADRAKVGDLGLSRVNNNLNMTQFTGTPKWEAPECLISSQYSKSADVYSYGVVLCEMVTGEEPFPEINDLGELKKVVVDQKIRPKLNPKAPNCPPFLMSLIKACWSHDPKKRPTFEQVVELLASPPQ